MAQERTPTAFLAVAAAVVGVVLGVLCARVVLVGSGLSLLPWALAGLVLGALSRSLRGALAIGALYGFVLAFTFMVAGYDGSSPLREELVPFAALGLVGAICGAVLASGSWFVRRRRGEGSRPVPTPGSHPTGSGPSRRRR